LLARDWEGFAEWPDWERYLLDAMSLLGAMISADRKVTARTPLSESREGRLRWVRECPRQESNLRPAV
jgi:hypothetical protein